MTSVAKVFEVGTEVWYLDNEDSTDIGKVFEIKTGETFYIGVTWADGETDYYHHSQLGIVA